MLLRLPTRRSMRQPTHRSVRRLGTTVAILALAAGGLAACKGSTTVGPTAVVTVTASDTSNPAGSASVSGSGTGAATATGSSTGTTSTPSAPSSGVGALDTSTRTAGPAPTSQTALPGRCENLLTNATVTADIRHDLAGTTTFIVGAADAGSGRKTSINCRYGIPGSDSDDRLLEIGVSLYGTAAQAAARVPATVSDFQAHGATAQTTTVEGVPATLLTRGVGLGYEPTIVLAYGQRTIAVTLSTKAVSIGAVGDDLLRLASLALTKTDPS